MKLLFVTPAIPYPPTNGYTNIASNHLRHLSKRHEIDLISFTSAPIPRSELKELGQWCSHIQQIVLPKWKSLLRVFTGIFKRQPFQVLYYSDEQMKRDVEQRLRSCQYDAVVFFMTRMAQYKPDWYKGPTVLAMIDPYILNYERSLPWRPWYSRLLISLEVDRLKKYEPEQSRLFDCVALVAESDLMDCRVLFRGAQLKVIPHAVNVDVFRASEAIPREPGMIVITGNMYYPPNIDAVGFFCSQIFPLILKRRPGANLWIVGSRPPRAVKKWHNGRDITVTGHVPDLKTYLNRAMVSVCPVRLKVGTQTKVLEALAMGTPVVTTSAGNNGVGATPGEHLYVEDTPELFAARVVELLDGKGWSCLAKNGRNFMSDNFTCEISAAKLETLLQDFKLQN